ncbi:HPP family protein [Nonomuraea sp. NPDC050556]|uniref:HPP family protein n=1 Tax=Nonomuraea sp. NPDC050556 TaxID=3364369 RepID=UPI0037ABD238
MVAGEPTLAPPIAASAALVAVAPGTPAARPWTVLLSHLMAVAAALATAFVIGPGPVAATVAAGLSVAAMVATGRFHAPAAASAVLIGATGAWIPALALLAGAATITLLAAAPWPAQQPTSNPRP